ncbi:MAG TPA: dienelactone hydrolase family protein [Acidimicrobiia bacterium]
MAVLPHEGTFAIMYGPLPVPVGSGYRPGYLTRPDEAGLFPVVIVIPGLGGLNSHIKDLCRRLARQGIAALSVDVYGAEYGTGDTLGAYASRADREVLTDLDEAYDFLQSDDVPWAIRERAGLLGIDVGGRFGLVLAATRPWAASTAVVSTPLTGDEERGFQVAGLLDHLPVPVLGLYGAADDLVAAETVDEAQNRNSSGQWLLYDGAGHDFMDDDSSAYHAAAAGDAFMRLVGFFRSTLPAAQIEDLG